jgi:hypothetical protein
LFADSFPNEILYQLQISYLPLHIHVQPFFGPHAV